MEQLREDIADFVEKIEQKQAQKKREYQGAQLMELLRKDFKSITEQLLEKYKVEEILDHRKKKFEQVMVLLETIKQDPRALNSNHFWRSFSNSNLKQYINALEAVTQLNEYNYTTQDPAPEEELHHKMDEIVIKMNEDTQELVKYLKYFRQLETIYTMTNYTGKEKPKWVKILWY